MSMKKQSLIQKMRYKWYRFLWDYAGRLPLRSMPVHLDLELTSRCNLACIMCPHGEKEKNFRIGDMDVAMAKALLKEGAGKIKSVKFNWRGEPTLYRHLAEVVAYAKKCGYIETMINTNLNCTPRTLEDIVRSGIDKIIVSIDSFDESVYARIRKGGDLKRVLANLDYLRELQRSGEYRFTLSVQARRQQLTAEEIFPEGVSVKPATLRTQGGEYIFGDGETAGRQDCLMPSRRLLIDWEGRVFGCCADWFGLGRVGTIDSATENNIKRIWHGGPLEALRKKLADGRAFECEPCKSCFSRESYIWKKSE